MAELCYAHPPPSNLKRCIDVYTKSSLVRTLATLARDVALVHDYNLLTN